MRLFGPHPAVFRDHTWWLMSKPGLTMGKANSPTPVLCLCPSMSFSIRKIKMQLCQPETVSHI